MNLHWLSQIRGIMPDWMWALLLAHAVNNCPTPNNRWGQWALSIVKFGVGQRVTAYNAWNGMQSEVTAVTAAQKEALRNGSELVVAKTPTGVLKPKDGA